jgi:hypothetical protein
MLPHYLVENERSRQQGHVADLYRDAEAHRLARTRGARAERDSLGLERPASWLAAGLRAAVAPLRRRFISPCGELMLLRAEADC